MGRTPRILDPNFPLHLVARCNNKESFPVPLPEAWEIMSDYLHLISKVFGIEVIAFVMMSNHFHLICQDPSLRLSEAMEFFMREVSREMLRRSGRINKLWGDTYRSSILLDISYFLHAHKYIYRNPVAAGICEKVEEYPWSTLQMLLGQKTSIIPIREDVTFFSSPEQTLRWLNDSYHPNEADHLRRALQKKKFRFPKDPTTKRSSPLEARDSLPAWLLTR